MINKKLKKFDYRKAIDKACRKMAFDTLKEANGLMNYKTQIVLGIDAWGVIFTVSDNGTVIDVMTGDDYIKFDEVFKCKCLKVKAFHPVLEYVDAEEYLKELLCH
jgi:hypothetical protein